MFKNCYSKTARWKYNLLVFLGYSRLSMYYELTLEEYDYILVTEDGEIGVCNNGYPGLYKFKEI